MAAFLESYNGQALDELIALESDYRIDSLVLAVEQALMEKSRARLAAAELVVLAVEGMEREVNNGGYRQFFGNSSREFTSFLVQALELIGCQKVAAISADAIDALAVPPDYDDGMVEEASFALSADQSTKLEDCDNRYYTCDEPIADRLFEYIKRNRDSIRIP